MVDDPWRQRDPLNACVSRSSVSTGYDLNGLAASGVIVLLYHRTCSPCTASKYSYFERTCGEYVRNHKQLKTLKYASILPKKDALE